MPTLNPLSLRPTETARLINSTRFGFVISQSRVYRDFTAGGFSLV